jgi:hypothetical protein
MMPVVTGVRIEVAEFQRLPCHPSQGCGVFGEVPENPCPTLCCFVQEDGGSGITIRE